MGSKPKIYSVAIELTAHCNQKCSYCYNAWREDGGAEVGAPSSEALRARVTKILDAIDVDHVTLTGGEPFAQPSTFDLLDLLQARGVGVQMISNGGLITEKIAARLAPYRVRYVQITLDGPTPEVHEEHVGEGRGHFEKTLAGVRALQKHGVPVVGCIVVTRKNASRVGETLALWQSLGVSTISFSRFSPAGYAARHAAELLLSVAEATNALEQALPYAKAGMRIHCTMPMPPCAVEVERFAPIQFGTCPIGTEMQEVALGPGGELRNCTLHRTKLGQVDDVLDATVDVAALLGAPERADYAKRQPEFCHGCRHASTCGGGCGAAAEWLLGDARATPDPFVWQHIDDQLAERLRAARATLGPADKRRLPTV
jgi:radical SAM protein with 4Fe4S-binding SPASM domain